MQLKGVIAIALAIASLANARVFPRQTVALVLCNDIISLDMTSEGQCQSMSTATGRCINQVQALSNGGWFDDPKAFINDAPSQHCVFFEDGYCDFNSKGFKNSYAPHTYANFSNLFGDRKINSFYCYYDPNAASNGWEEEWNSPLPSATSNLSAAAKRSNPVVMDSQEEYQAVIPPPTFPQSEAQVEKVQLHAKRSAGRQNKTEHC